MSVAGNSFHFDGMSKRGPKNTTKKRRIISVGSAGFVFLSLMAGSTTTATWSDATSVDGSQITSGNLDIEKIGSTEWSERSLDSANFGNQILLSDYRITPGDTIQARQKIDVALEGKNMRASFAVNTEELSGDLYSSENGISGNFMVIDEGGFVVVPRTPLGTNSPEVVLVPDDVTPQVDGVKDYTAIVSISFDRNTPDRVRAMVSADLETLSFHLNQTRSNLMGPVPQSEAVYNTVVQTIVSNRIVANGGDANFTHTLTNNGNSPLEDIEVRTQFGTESVIQRLDAGESVRFPMTIANITEDGDILFEFYGKENGVNTKLAETTGEVIVEKYAVNIVRSSSSVGDENSGVNSVTITHEITNDSTGALSNIIVKSDGLPDSSVSGRLEPGESTTLTTYIPAAGWEGVSNIEFTTYGDSVDNQGLVVNVSSSRIAAGSVNVEANTFAIGHGHSCDIRNGGEVWCWGSNSYGEIGSPLYNSYDTAYRSGNISDAVSVEAGGNSTLAVTATGQLWAWGREFQFTPNMIMTGVKKADIGNGSAAIVLLEDGTVAECSGSTCTATSKTFSGAKDVSKGGTNTYVIDGDGTVWGKGTSSYNALGGGSYSGSDSPSSGWTRISDHTNATTLFDVRWGGGAYELDNGEVYGWGWAGWGQLGVPASSLQVVHLPHLDNPKSLAFGGDHLVLVKQDGTVWTSGRNNAGQLGDGTSNNSNHLIQVDGLTNATQATASYYSSGVLTPGGKYGWGENPSKKLGISGNTSVPVLIDR